jgi:hypothetical protein
MVQTRKEMCVLIPISSLEGLNGWTYRYSEINIIRIAGGARHACLIFVEVCIYQRVQYRVQSGRLQ